MILLACVPPVHWCNLCAAAGIDSPSLLDLENTSDWSRHCHCSFLTPSPILTISRHMPAVICSGQVLSNSHTYRLFFSPTVLIISRWKIIILHSCLFLYWVWPKRGAFHAGQGQLPRYQGFNNNNLSTIGEKE